MRQARGLPRVQCCLSELYVMGETRMRLGGRFSTGRLAHRTLLAGACAYAALSAGAALAQEAPEGGEETVAQVSEIVVTGSRIARRD